jgi:hypothetical protein
VTCHEALQKIFNINQKKFDNVLFCIENLTNFCYRDGIADVFFPSLVWKCSPQVWGNPDGIRCAKETMPLLKWRGPLWLGTDWDMFRVARNITRAAAPRVPITFVDITTMSERRKDGHTSVHTIRQGKVLGPEEQADPGTYADCIHWCLPGVPDIWNLLLYARIMSRPALQVA